MESKIVEELQNFGLSRQEALIYLELIKHGQLSGYELSKETGISRSNVYNTLSELVNHGACYLIEGEAAKYIPVDLELFMKNRISFLQEKAKFIIANKPATVANVDGYITIKGATNIKNKICQMLEETQARLYLFAASSIIENFRDELEQLSLQKKKIVILSDGFKLKGAKIYTTNVEEGQIRFITDSSFVLTGILTGSTEDKCLFSGQENLVSVMKEYLKNKIFLLEMNL